MAHKKDPVGSQNWLWGVRSPTLPPPSRASPWDVSGGHRVQTRTLLAVRSFNQLPEKYLVNKGRWQKETRGDISVRTWSPGVVREEEFRIR